MDNFIVTVTYLEDGIPREKSAILGNSSNKNSMENQINIYTRNFVKVIEPILNKEKIKHILDLRHKFNGDKELIAAIAFMYIYGILPINEVELKENGIHEFCKIQKVRFYNTRS